MAWYSKGLPGSAEFRAEINRLSDAEAVRAAVVSFYSPLLQKAAA
jgi:tRNA-dihydrouridine synthase B